MPIVKRIVCLANSRKLGGHCIAGREWDGRRVGAWIRPVGSGERGEIYKYECSFQDGSNPEVLDIIDVPLKQHCPKTYQSENWSVDPEYYWVRVGRLTWQSLARLCEEPSRLWVNGYGGYPGENDRIPLCEAERLKHSLVLLKVRSIVITTVTRSDDRRRKVYGEFVHKHVRYRLSVTDPVIEQFYLAKPDGRYEIGECYLTISLGEDFEGFCYKLIAAIIEPWRCTAG